MQNTTNDFDDFGVSDDIVPMWIWKTQSPRCQYRVQRPGVVAGIDPASWRRFWPAYPSPLAWLYALRGTIRLQTARDDRPILLIGHAPIGLSTPPGPSWSLILSGHTLVLGQRQTLLGGGDSDDDLSL